MDGDKYEGEYRNGSAHGHGVWVGVDGDKYEGDWKYDMKHGRGVFVAGQNSEWAGEIYEGKYRNGERHGQGAYRWPNGDRYEGEFRNGRARGHGVFVFANGDKCEGDWRESRLIGTGKGWKNGQIRKCYDDNGIIKFADEDHASRRLVREASGTNCEICLDRGQILTNAASAVRSSCMAKVGNRRSKSSQSASAKRGRLRL